MRLVLVEWTDSFGCSSSWQDIQEPLESPKAMECRSVGWLAHDGEDCKVLIPHMAILRNGEPNQGCGDMTIPCVAITRIQELCESEG